MLQIRMTIFNSLLLVGYYIAALAFNFLNKNKKKMGRGGGRWLLLRGSPPYTSYPAGAGEGRGEVKGWIKIEKKRTKDKKKKKKVCQNAHLLFYAQSPDFHKLGLCYYLKILYL